MKKAGPKKAGIKQQDEPRELSLSELIRWVLVEAGYEEHYMFLDFKTLSQLMYDNKDKCGIGRQLSFNETSIPPYSRKLEQIYDIMITAGTLKPTEITMLALGTRTYLEKKAKPTDKEKVVIEYMANNLLENLKIRKEN